MTEKSMINWSKDGTASRSYGFQFSSKLSGNIKRKGFWSPDGSGEIGTRTLRFRSKGKAKMALTIYDASSDKELGTLDFYWRDFQRSKLKLSDGKIYQFRSFDILRGAWSWAKDDSSTEELVFRVDSPLQRSGTIENLSKDLPALERDLLLLLGLHLTHYINNWLITFVIVVIMFITGR
ncbi:hypothetical protein HQ531_02700 [bacterium]|nr:hypothetical protein [bacterium]